MENAYIMEMRESKHCTKSDSHTLWLEESPTREQQQKHTHQTEERGWNVLQQWSPGLIWRGLSQKEGTRDRSFPTLTAAATNFVVSVITAARKGKVHDPTSATNYSAELLTCRCRSQFRQNSVYQ